MQFRKKALPLLKFVEKFKTIHNYSHCDLRFFKLDFEGHFNPAKES